MSLLRKGRALDENVPQKKKRSCKQEAEPRHLFVDSENSEEDIPKKA